ncbi:YkyA family protein [Metabacillus litoralis]|nr:YkyA family protein [Metabacillus litoralis]UHA62674.1 YkyA family protein [Metabacillus litoralis]
MKQLETQIAKINKSYQSVMEQNNEFNKLTEQYNDLKIKFYEEAELNVEKVNNAHVYENLPPGRFFFDSLFQDGIHLRLNKLIAKSLCLRR